MHLGAPDPTGEQLSIVDSETGDLALRHLASGEITRMTENKARGEFAYFSTFARSGRQIAYAWFNEAHFYELRVVDLTARTVRVVHRNEERRFVQPCAWMPGDREILTLFFRNDNVSQIALVDAASGAVRVLKSLDWVYPNRMDCSPDGKWIVYDDLAKEGSAQRDLYLLSSDGSALRKLVENDAHDVFPLFAPDGQSVLYLSDRAGTMDLWRQPLNRAAAKRVASDLGRALAMGISRNGNYFFARRTGSAEIRVGPPDAPRPLLARSPEDAAQPAWSADGKQIAFLAKAGQENFGQDARVIVLANVETGAHRVVSPRLVHMDRVTWHPAGTSLLVSGGDPHGQRGLYSVDIENAETRPLVRERAAAYQGFAGVYSKEGAAVYFVRGAELRTKDAVLYRGLGDLRHIVISHDGNWLAFCEQAEATTLVKVIRTKGGEARQVASVRQSGVSGLDWMADSTALISSFPSDPPSVWRIPVQDGKPERLAWNLNQHGPVRWHPNGKWIAYSTGQARTEVCVLEKTAV